MALTHHCSPATTLQTKPAAANKATRMFRNCSGVGLAMPTASHGRVRGCGGPTRLYGGGPPAPAGVRRQRRRSPLERCQGLWLAWGPCRSGAPAGGGLWVRLRAARSRGRAPAAARPSCACRFALDRCGGSGSSEAGPCRSGPARARRLSAGLASDGRRGRVIRLWWVRPRAGLARASKVPAELALRRRDSLVPPRPLLPVLRSPRAGRVRAGPVGRSGRPSRTPCAAPLAPR